MPHMELGEKNAFTEVVRSYFNLDIILMLRMHRTTRCECGVGKVDWKLAGYDVLFFLSSNFAWNPQKRTKAARLRSLNLCQRFTERPCCCWQLHCCIKDHLGWFTYFSFCMRIILHIPADHFKSIVRFQIDERWDNPPQSVFRRFYFTVGQVVMWWYSWKQNSLFKDT